MSTAFKKTLYQLILSLLVLLMLYAAASKGFSFERFVQQLSKSPLLHEWPQLAAALILLVESTIVILLLFKRTQRAALIASGAMLLLFSGYIMGMMLLSHKLPCSCGGILEKLSWRGHLFLNLSFVLISCAGVYLHRFQDT
jgi:hypothetical protein